MKSKKEYIVTEIYFNDLNRLIAIEYPPLYSKRVKFNQISPSENSANFL